MEPLITIEGYNMMQDHQRSRDLLNDFYRRQGYEVVTPKAHVIAPSASEPSKSGQTGESGDKK